MAEPRPADRLTLDLITSYLAAAAKVGSWAVVLAVVARVKPAEALAFVVFLRSVLTLLNHAHLGVPAVLVQRLAKLRASAAGRTTAVESATILTPIEGRVLAYESAQPVAVPTDRTPEERLSTASSTVAWGLLFACSVLIIFATWLVYIWIAPNYDRLEPVAALVLVVTMAFGWLCRAISEIPAAWLLHQGQLARDNAYVVVCEVAFAALVLVLAGSLVFSRTGGLERHHSEVLLAVGASFAISGVALALCRVSSRPPGTASPVAREEDEGSDEAVELVRSGLPITLGNLADYLYGPVSMLVVAAFLTTQDAAAYGVAIYFDSVLLLLVAGVAAPLLPRIADASARHDIARVRKLYITATLACLGVLALAATCVVLFAPWILSVWLKNPPPGVTAVLPIVLLHTVIGGTAGVARSVLVGIGAHRAYAVSALVGGLLNVALGLLFVTQFDMGLAGIAWATVIAVALRCAVWMPWYVLRRLRLAAVV